MESTQELLRAYGRLLLHDANEAETRLKVIDQVLFGVLGWMHEDVNVEERTSADGTAQFADYIVRTASTAFVVEAKRVGATFRDIPRVRRHKLSGTLMGGLTGDAIRQARQYARDKGVPFAVISNGAQWIIFPATRIDQVEFSESSAIIFDSLESVLKDDFSEFTALLSRNNVIGGSLETELLGRNEDQFGERKLKHSFTNRGTAPSQNPLYPLIESAVIAAFTDEFIGKDPDLLEKCYVRTADRQKFDSQIKMFLTREEPIIRKRTARPLQKKKESQALDEAIKLAERQPRPFIMLVLGKVGAGKTTFLRYTRLVSTREFFTTTHGGPYPHWIEVDFKNFGPGDDPSLFLYQGIRGYMDADSFLSNYEQCVRPAYINEMRALREGVLKPLAGSEEKVNEKIADFLIGERGKQIYVDKLLRYATNKRPIFLVIDNVDQIEDIEIQSTIFSASVAIAHRAGLNLIVSLRESTFVRHRSTALFDAFDFHAITIDAPPVLAVLSRRFFVMKQLLKGQKGEFTAENGARIEVADLSILADLISSSVLGTTVGRVIDVLATSDIRLALRMTREFLSSGYTNPGRAVTIYRNSGQYVLPRHEALRSVLLGNQTVYSEAYSIIGNPFDSHLAKTSLQLLRLFVLNSLCAFSSKSDFQYVDGEAIGKSLRKIGIADDITARILADLCKLRFLSTSSHGDATLSASYFPTRLGGYIVRYLIADLTYLEAVMMDTFIADRKVWDELRRLSEEVEAERDVVNRLSIRHKRISTFYSYMQSLYESLLLEAQRRALPPEWTADQLQNMADPLSRNMKKALDSARRHYGQAM